LLVIITAAGADQSYYPLLEGQRRTVAWPVVLRCGGVVMIAESATSLLLVIIQCPSDTASLIFFTMSITAHDCPGTSLRFAMLESMSE
jgi:hypothetical protein